VDKYAGVGAISRGVPGTRTYRTRCKAQQRDAFGCPYRSHNQITRVPDTLCNLTGLTALNLMGNQLVCVWGGGEGGHDALTEACCRLRTASVEVLECHAESPSPLFFAHAWVFTQKQPHF
jgi:hypothetical protein